MTTTSEIASLGFSIDTSQAVKATGDLNALKQSSIDLAGTNQQTQQGFALNSQAMGQQGQSTQQLIGQTQQLQQVQQQQVDQLKAQANAYSELRDVIVGTGTALHDFGEKAAQLIPALQPVMQGIDNFYRLWSDGARQAAAQSELTARAMGLTTGAVIDFNRQAGAIGLSQQEGQQALTRLTDILSGTSQAAIQARDQIERYGVSLQGLKDTDADKVLAGLVVAFGNVADSRQKVSDIFNLTGLKDAESLAKIAQGTKALADAQVLAAAQQIQAAQQAAASAPQTANYYGAQNVSGTKANDTDNLIYIPNADAITAAAQKGQQAAQKAIDDAETLRKAAAIRQVQDEQHTTDTLVAEFERRETAFKAQTVAVQQAIPVVSEFSAKLALINQEANHASQSSIGKNLFSQLYDNAVALKNEIVDISKLIAGVYDPKITAGAQKIIPSAEEIQKASTYLEGALRTSLADLNTEYRLGQVSLQGYLNQLKEYPQEQQQVNAKIAEYTELRAHGALTDQQYLSLLVQLERQYGLLANAAVEFANAQDKLHPGLKEDAQRQARGATAIKPLGASTDLIQGFPEFGIDTLGRTAGNNPYPDLIAAQQQTSLRALKDWDDQSVSSMGSADAIKNQQAMLDILDHSADSAKSFAAAMGLVQTQYGVLNQSSLQYNQTLDALQHLLNPTAEDLKKLGMTADEFAVKLKSMGLTTEILSAELLHLQAAGGGQLTKQINQTRLNAQIIRTHTGAGRQLAQLDDSARGQLGLAPGESPNLNTEAGRQQDVELGLQHTANQELIGAQQGDTLAGMQRRVQYAQKLAEAAKIGGAAVADMQRANEAYEQTFSASGIGEQTAQKLADAEADNKRAQTANQLVQVSTADIRTNQNLTAAYDGQRESITALTINMALLNKVTDGVINSDDQLRVSVAQLNDSVAQQVTTFAQQNSLLRDQADLTKGLTAAASQSDAAVQNQQRINQVNLDFKHQLIDATAALAQAEQQAAQVGDDQSEREVKRAQQSLDALAKEKQARLDLTQVAQDQARAQQMAADIRSSNQQLQGAQFSRSIAGEAPETQAVLTQLHQQAISLQNRGVDLSGADAQKLLQNTASTASLEAQTQKINQSIDSTTQRIGDGVADAFASALTGDKSKNALEQLGDLAKQTLSRTFSEIFSSTVIQPIIRPLVSSITTSLMGGGSAAPSVQQVAAAIGGSVSSTGTVTTQSGSTISANDLMSIAGKLGGGGNTGASLISAADNFGYNSLGIGTLNLSGPGLVSAQQGIAEAAGQAGIGVIGNEAVQATAGTAAGTAGTAVAGGVGSSVASYLPAVGAVAGIANFASNPTVGSGITAVGGIVSALPALFGASAALGPIGLGIAAVGMIVSSLMGSKTKAHDSALSYINVDDDGKAVSQGNITLDTKGQSQRVQDATTAYTQGLNSFINLTGGTITDRFDRKQAFGEAPAYNTFYAPNISSDEPDRQAKYGYGAQGPLSEAANIADRAIITAIKDPVNWSGLSDTVQAAIAHSTATTSKDLMTDVQFGQNFPDMIAALKTGSFDPTSTLQAQAKAQVQSTLDQIVNFKDTTKELLGPSDNDTAGSQKNIDDANEAAKEMVEMTIGLRTAKQPIDDAQKAWQLLMDTMDDMDPVLKEVGISADDAAKGFATLKQNMIDQVNNTNKIQLLVAGGSSGFGQLSTIGTQAVTALSDTKTVNGDLDVVDKLIIQTFKNTFSQIKPEDLSQVTGQFELMRKQLLAAGYDADTVTRMLGDARQALTKTNEANHVNSEETFLGLFNKISPGLTTDDPVRAQGLAPAGNAWGALTQLATMLRDEAPKGNVHDWDVEAIGTVSLGRQAFAGISDEGAAQVRAMLGTFEQSLEALGFSADIANRAVTGLGEGLDASLSDTAHQKQVEQEKANQQALIEQTQQLSDIFAAAAARASAAAAEIQKFLDSLNFGDLSPLSLSNQLSVAQQMFNKSPSGDSAQQLLQVGSSLYGNASQDYATLVASVRDQLVKTGDGLNGSAAALLGPLLGYAINGQNTDISGPEYSGSGSITSYLPGVNISPTDQGYGVASTRDAFTKSPSPETATNFLQQVSTYYGQSSSQYQSAIQLVQTKLQSSSSGFDPSSFGSLLHTAGGAELGPGQQAVANEPGTVGEVVVSGPARIFSPEQAKSMFTGGSDSKRQGDALDRLVQMQGRSLQIQMQIGEGHDTSMAGMAAAIADLSRQLTTQMNIIRNMAKGR